MAFGIDRIAAYAPLDLRRGGKDLEFYNIERVRGYLEQNLGCKKKEVIAATGLHPRTVAKAIKIIRDSRGERREQSAPG